MTGSKGEIEKLLGEGFAALNAGRLTEAASICQQILTLDRTRVEGHFLVGLVAAEIADTRADAVITFHPESGVSDHRDHKRIGAATREAAGRSEAAPTLYYVLGPRPALNRFGGETGAKVAAHQPPPAFAVKAPARDKKRAWRIHQSQSEFLQAAWGLSPTVLYLLWTEEYYARADETGAP